MSAKKRVSGKDKSASFSPGLSSSVTYSDPLALIDLNNASREELNKLILAREETSRRFASFILSHRPLSHRDLLVCAPGITHARLRLIKARTLPLLGETASVHVRSSKSSERRSKGEKKPCEGPHRSDPKKIQVKRFLSQYDTERDMTKVVVGSWQVPCLGRDSPLGRNFVRQGIKRAAQVVRQFDVVSLQGIRSLTVLAKLSSRLRGWEYVVSPAMRSLSAAPGYAADTDDGGRQEMYAVFWRPDKVRLVGMPVSISDAGDTRSRRPFVCYFTVSDSDLGLDFVLVTLKHEPDASLVAQQTSMDMIRQFCSKEENLIIAGSLGVSGPEAKAIEGWTPLVRTDNPTTFALSKKTRDKVAAIDNLWMPTRSISSTAFTGESGIVSFQKYLFEKSSAGKLEAASQIGEHRAVWASFYNQSSLFIDDNSESIARYAQSKKLPPIPKKTAREPSEEYSSEGYSSEYSGYDYSNTSSANNSRSASFSSSASASTSASSSGSLSSGSRAMLEREPFCATMTFNYTKDGEFSVATDPAGNTNPNLASKLRADKDNRSDDQPGGSDRKSCIVS